jgi:hypothetical protein
MQHNYLYDRGLSAIHVTRHSKKQSQCPGATAPPAMLLRVSRIEKTEPMIRWVTFDKSLTTIPYRPATRSPQPASPLQRKTEKPNPTRDNGCIGNLRNIDNHRVPDTHPPQPPTKNGPPASCPGPTVMLLKYCFGTERRSIKGAAQAAASLGKVGKCTWTRCHAVMIRGSGPRSLRIPPWPPFGQAWPETTKASIQDIDSISRPITSKNGGTCPPIFPENRCPYRPHSQFFLSQIPVSLDPPAPPEYYRPHYQYRQQARDFAGTARYRQRAKKPTLPASICRICSDVLLLKEILRKHQKK